MITHTVASGAAGQSVVGFFDTDQAGVTEHAVGVTGLFVVKGTTGLPVIGGFSDTE